MAVNGGMRLARSQGVCEWCHCVGSLVHGIALCPTCAAEVYDALDKLKRESKGLAPAGVEESRQMAGRLGECRG